MKTKQKTKNPFVYFSGTCISLETEMLVLQATKEEKVITLRIFVCFLLKNVLLLLSQLEKFNFGIMYTHKSMTSS